MFSLLYVWEWLVWVLPYKHIFTRKAWRHWTFGVEEKVCLIVHTTRHYSMRKPFHTGHTLFVVFINKNSANGKRKVLFIIMQTVVPLSNFRYFSPVQEWEYSALNREISHTFMFGYCHFLTFLDDLKSFCIHTNTALSFNAKGEAE